MVTGPIGGDGGGGCGGAPECTRLADPDALNPGVLPLSWQGGLAPQPGALAPQSPPADPSASLLNSARAGVNTPPDAAATGGLVAWLQGVPWVKVAVVVVLVYLGVKFLPRLLRRKGHS